MITLIETNKPKFPGKSSILISCGFNEKVINIIKSTGNAIWDKNNKLWEIPITSLAFIIDNLAPLDDITLNILKSKDKSKVIDIPKLDKSMFKTKLFDYQLDGVIYGLTHDKWLLLDCPGLGKTIQTMYIAQQLKERNNISHCLVICGVNSLKSNWKKEIHKHSDLSCKILGERTTRTGKTKIGKVSERLEDLKHPIEEFFVITNIETLRNNDIIKLINKGVNKFDMIIFDEIQVAKSPTSIQGKNILKLKNAKYKIGCTGTLIMNNPLDSYVPLKWIGEENSTFTNYKGYYCRYGGPMNNIIVGFKNLNTLKEILSNCSLRRTKDLLDLPEKTIIVETLDMQEDHKSFYVDIEKGIIDEVDKVKLNTSSILTMITRLRQATACPSVLTTKSISPTKLLRCAELINEITGNGEKVVVFSTFKESITQLRELIPNISFITITGDTKDSDISDLVDKFQNDASTTTLLATWQKAGTGLTLTAASYAIFIDTPWTDAAFTQACDRIYRIGTTKKVFIYVLQCAETIDEMVYNIVQDKSAISDYIVDDIQDENTMQRLQKYLQNL